MAPESLGLWMLFLWIQEGESTVTKCENVTGIVGEAADLTCCYGGKDLKPDLRVQWQLQDKDDCVVAACLPDQSPPVPCKQYKNRTKLNKDCLHLQLLSFTSEDSRIYECILQKKENGKYQKIFHGSLELTENESLNAPYLASTTIAPVTPANQQQTQVIAISSLVALVVIVTIIIFIFLYKRKHPFYRAYTAPVGMDTSLNMQRH